MKIPHNQQLARTCLIISDYSTRCAHLHPLYITNVMPTMIIGVYLIKKKKSPYPT